MHAKSTVNAFIIILSLNKRKNKRKNGNKQTHFTIISEKTKETEKKKERLKED